VERYVIRGGAEGFARLRTLASLRLPDTRMLFDRIDVQAGWRCADLGSGSGDITAEIARRVGRSGSVTGFDMDTTKVDLAGALAAERGLDTVRFAVADLRSWTATPLLRPGPATSARSRRSRASDVGGGASGRRPGCRGRRLRRIVLPPTV
jgi:SAM-dependent methyltransferase